MNRKTTLEFKVGLFISLGILALLIFVLATGKASIRGRGYELKVAFGYVGGLEEGAPVRVSGVRVGEVKRIEMEYDVTPRIILVMKMKPDVRIGRHSRVTIRTLGIIGEKYVEISPCQEKEFALPGETLTGIDPVDLDRFINMGEDLVRNLNEVVVGVQRVIGDRDVQNRVKSILDNTDGVVSGLRRITQDEEMVQRFKNILAGAETVLSRTDNFLEDATKLVASLETTSGEVKNFLSRNQPRVEGVLARVEELAATSNSAVKLFSEKVPKLEAVATSFQQTAEESTKLVRQLSTRGLVARLLKEETLVDEIKTEVQLLQETTAEIKKAAEKFTEITADFKKTAGAITEVSQKTADILTEIKAGQGTLSKLLSDKETSETVKAILENMEEISRGIKEHGIFWRGLRTGRSR